MKKAIGFAIVATLAASTAFAQVPIIDVRNTLDPNCYPTGSYGAEVTIEGLVVCGTELGSAGPAYIEDATAGIAFYFWPQPFTTGDYVTLTAFVDQYQGLLQLADEPGVGTPPSWTIHSSGNPVTPHVITIPEMGEDNEGKLITIECVFFHDAGLEFAYEHAIEDAEGNVGKMYVDSSTDIDGTIIPGGYVDLTGCHGQYDENGPDYCDEGYEIIPRSLADIQSSPSPTEDVTWGSMKSLYR